jgi:hypothetical protein
MSLVVAGSPGNTLRSRPRGVIESFVDTLGPRLAQATQLGDEDQIGVRMFSAQVLFVGTKMRQWNWK